MPEIRKYRVELCYGYPSHAQPKWITVEAYDAADALVQAGQDLWEYMDEKFVRPIVGKIEPVKTEEPKDA